MHGQEPVTECYQGGVTTPGGGGRFRRFAVVLEEIGDLDAGRQLDQPLLEPQQQVIDLGGFRLGLLPGDFPQRKCFLLAAKSEENAVTAAPFL
jgi:hypothetical protein